jgi:Arc/MetJ-type ribon-helix-helix transcriptional regulator
MPRSTDSYVLVRVKLKSSVVEELKSVADAETDRTGRYVYVSNLIREALREWLNAHRVNL